MTGFREIMLIVTLIGHPVGPQKLLQAMIPCKRRLFSKVIWASPTPKSLVFTFSVTLQ